MGNRRLNTVIKIIIITLVAASVIVMLLNLLILKSSDGYNQMRALYKQPQDSIDVLFVGSSLVYSDISTGVLWDEYGIASYDLGAAEAPSWVSYYQLKEALKTQHPKVICYEASLPGMQAIQYQKDTWSSATNYGFKWSRDRIEELRVNSAEDDFYKRLNPFNIMHGRYNDLSEKDFDDRTDLEAFKGFVPKERVEEIEPTVLTGTDEMDPCSDKSEEYVRKIIQLAKDQGVPLIMFASPRKIGEPAERAYNYMDSIARSEGLEFIDFNKRYSDMDLDFSCDMAEALHLNYSGNYKFSKYLGQVLKERYDIPDRRGDDRYVSWDRDALLQRRDRNNKNIQNSSSAEEVMQLAQDRYILFLIHDGMAGILDNNQAVALQEVDENGEKLFRLTYRYGDDSFIFTETNNQGERMIHLFINDLDHEEFYGNILMVYDAVTNEYIGWEYF